jgi:predicted Zn-ribbon and HTH transcriptional regulator
MRLAEADYNSLDSRNIKWVGTELPKNNRTKTPWRCLVCGYEWMSIYNSISQGSGCPKCVGKARITEEDYNSFVSRNVKWIGEELPRTIKIKTSWLCLKCGNRWRTTYDCVKGRGSGCPRCANIVNGAQASTQQVEIAEMDRLRYS